MKAKKVVAIINEAEAVGALLWVEEGRLHFKVRPGSMPSKLLENLTNYREEIISALDSPNLIRRNRNTSFIEVPEYLTHFFKETSEDVALANGCHFVVKLAGKLDVQFLNCRVQALARQHEVLRSKVSLINGAPYLFFDNQDVLVVDTFDISEVQEDGRNQIASATVDQFICAPFEDGRQFRIFLIKLSEHEHVFGFVLNHFIGDVYSRNVLANQLLMMFNTANIQSDEAESRTLQYSDYLIGLDEWLSGRGAAFRLNYWKEQMNGAPSTHLPYDHKVDDDAVANLENMPFQISDTTCIKLRHVAKKCGATMFVVNLAAKILAMAKTLHRDDIIITLLTMGREQTSLNNMVGNLFNCIAIRVNLTNDMILIDYIKYVQREYLIACRYQLPWGQLWPHFSDIGASIVSPLLNFVRSSNDHRAEPQEVRNTHGLVVEPIAIKYMRRLGTARRHASHELNIHDDGNSIIGFVTYHSLLYDQSTIRSFISTFTNCLDAITINSDTQIRDIMETV